MADSGIGDYFISDIEDDFDDEDLLTPPVVVPVRSPEPVEEAVADPEPVVREPVDAAPVAPRTSVPEPPAAQAKEPTVAPAAEPTGPQATSSTASREQRLASALDELMGANHDIQATALVSLDGFTMASALPESMQEDRVGAMSAAILGLGERAAAELGRGALSQVYIEGSDGIVVLMSAGGRAVLTALASAEARLGLVLYDMRSAADEIGDVLA